MIDSFQFLGLTFHIYGLIIGGAVAVSIWLLELQFKKANLPQSLIDCLWKIIPLLLFGALLGARLWHLVSDWQLYAGQPLKSFYVWNGGLSIIGALLGGSITLWLIRKSALWCDNISSLLLADALVFVLPVGQAIGRIGNWVNQELYGLPSNLPWKIYIEPINRLTGYQQVAYYHPLFLYEMVFLGGFAAALWWLQSKYDQLKIGTGSALLAYLAYFGFIRFGLEFLRLDKPGLSWGNISINQGISLVVGLISSWLLVRLWRSGRS